MGLIEYQPGTAFPGTIGRTAEESSPAWPRPPRAAPGAPNVLMIAAYRAPFPFTGTLHTVTIDVSGDLITDTEAEMGVTWTENQR